jgi:hypothetical protein
MTVYHGLFNDFRALATCALASEQASPTLSTMTRLDRLLSFVPAHPNGRKIFRASEMILCVHSDASYLSRPRAWATTRRPSSPTTPSTTPSPPTLPASLSYALLSRRPNTAASSRQHASPWTSGQSSPTSATPDPYRHLLRQRGRHWPSQSHRMSKDVKIFGHAVPLAT